MKTKLLSFLFLLMICPSSMIAQFAPENFVTFMLPRVFEVVPADITGDGYTDIIAVVRDVSEDDFKITSFRNDPNAPGNFSASIIIDPDADETQAIDVADFDGDGRLDIIRTSDESNKIVWYRNQDGNGNYSPEILISTFITEPNDVVPGDFDGDGDVDFVVCSGNQNRIYWFENLDGMATFSNQIEITQHVLNPLDLEVVDLDQDGDLDIVSLSSGDRKIAWFENLDGLGNFSTPQLVTTEATHDNRLKVADIDGDGDHDLVSSSNNRISWYRHLDGLGNFDLRINVTWTAGYTRGVDFGDFEGDNDLEIVYASSSPSYLGYFRNLDGDGTFGLREQVTEVLEQPTMVAVADMNGDGNPDLISNSFSMGWIAWYEYSEVLSTEDEQLGDVNIYPIPSSDVVNVQTDKIISKLDVFNVRGQLLLSSKDQNSIDISSLNSGLYLMSISDNQGNYHLEKIIKE